MTQLTVRYIEEEWVDKAKQLAAERGISINALLRSAIMKELEVGEKKQTNGLEKLAGSMPFESAEQEKAWEDSMKVFDQIDEVL